MQNFFLLKKWKSYNIELLFSEPRPSDCIVKFIVSHFKNKHNNITYRTYHDLDSDSEPLVPL